MKRLTIDETWKCFFCGKTYSTKAGINEHFVYGQDEFPVCINGKPIEVESAN